jgi:hypothetical protein
LNIG